MKRIIYENPDGSVAVIIPALNYTGTMQELRDKVVPVDAVASHIVEHTDIPTDRTFRSAWKRNGATIDHDISKCKAIQKDAWRALRKPLLEALDVEMVRALEDGDTVKRDEIKVKKQALRDITLTPLPDDVDEIRNVWNEELLGEKPFA